MRTFKIDVPQSEVEDLRQRLERVRWPDDDHDSSWDRGTPLAYLQELVSYWRDEYDWRSAEVELNRYPQSTVDMEGAVVHFLHVRSPERSATPLLMTHGWPGSFIEFTKVIDPLTDPRSHGGDPRDACHLVIPSIPGFGFSRPTSGMSWTISRVATAWSSLMDRLGYRRYVAHGTDIGSWITHALALTDPDHVAGAHTNFLVTPPRADESRLASLAPVDLQRLDRLRHFMDHSSGYMKIQSTRPRTLGHGLTDSPVGQLSWIVEKYQEWADTAEAPEDAVDRDQILTNATMYWFTKSGSSSANFYYENAALMPTASAPPDPPPPTSVPFAVSVFPGDPAPPVRSLAEEFLPNIVQWTEHRRGGHFPAMEAPEHLVADLRALVRSLHP